MSGHPQDVETPTEAPESPASRSKVFPKLMRDIKLSHGAFRLWHCLYDYWNPKSGVCWPGQRTIAEDMGCITHSIKGWTNELVEAGWVSIFQKKKGGRITYTLLDGAGNSLAKVSRKSATQTVAEKRNSFRRRGKARHGVVENSDGVSRKSATEVSIPLKGGIHREEVTSAPCAAGGSALEAQPPSPGAGGSTATVHKYKGGFKRAK